jgi:thiol-disulfide isomerase/thioredoxin
MAVILSYDADFASLISTNDKVIVKYYADWCGNCKLFAPKFRRLSDDERFAGITFLDVNAEENEQARHAGGVDNLPYFAVFKNGERLAGRATSKEESVIELLTQLQ